MSIWVVGGTSGIGRACAERLWKEYPGVETMVTGEEVDVRDQQNIQQFSTGKLITKMVYSAGTNYLHWWDQMDPEEMKRLYDINVIGLLRVMRELRNLTDVVVIGSDAAWRPMRTSVAYCPSKAALHMAAQVIARERSEEGFRINVVAPGKVECTKMTEYTDRRSTELRPSMDHIAYQKAQIPSGKFCTTEDVAEVVVNLLFTESLQLNGAIIPVNGGRY